MKSYRYTPLQVLIKKCIRLFSPVPKSPRTMGEVEDICDIHLVPPQELVKFFVECIAILERRRGKNIGDYLEFGVFNGSSIGSMYTALQSTGMQSRLFGFDSFEGLPTGSEQDDQGVWKPGYYACSFEDMTRCLSRRGIDADEITWITGWYEDTLHEGLVTKYSLHSPGIVFIDCDTYSSSKAVLDFITPLIHEPVIICLDDRKLNDLDIKGLGEYKSFNEFLEKNTHLQASEIRSYNRKSKSFLVQQRV